MPADAQPVRAPIPRWLWVVAVGAYLPVLAALVVLVVQLEDSRSTVDGRLAVSVDRLRDATLPLAAAATPVARAATADRPAAQRLNERLLDLTGQVAPLAREATPLARELRAARPGAQLRTISALATDLNARQAGVQLQKAGALSDNLLRVDAGGQIRQSGLLATTLLDAGVGGAVADVRRVSGLLQASDLPATTRALTETADELNRGTRLGRLLERLTAVLGQATTLRTVPEVTAAAEAVTARIVPLIERGIAMLSETLAVTKDTGRHAANLDRKLGGDLPLLP